MTEETTTTAPDPAKFNLEDWLVGGTKHRVHKTVTIYLNAHLAEEIEALDRQIREAEENTDGESLADAGAARELEARQEELLQRLQEAKATVRVHGLIDSEVQACRESLGEKPKDYDYSSDVNYVYAQLAAAATLEGQTLTAEQWALLHETIGPQMRTIQQAFVQAMLEVDPVTPRFRGRGPGAEPSRP